MNDATPQAKKSESEVTFQTDRQTDMKRVKDSYYTHYGERVCS